MFVYVTTTVQVCDYYGTTEPLIPFERRWDWLSSILLSLFFLNRLLSTVFDRENSHLDRIPGIRCILLCAVRVDPFLCRPNPFLFDTPFLFHLRLQQGDLVSPQRFVATDQLASYWRNKQQTPVGAFSISSIPLLLSVLDKILKSCHALVLDYGWRLIVYDNGNYKH